MEDKWDGQERRNINWDEIISHMAMVNEKLSWINVAIQELTKKVGIQNGRVGKLEQWKAYVLGCAAVSGFVLGVIFTIIFKK